MRRFRCSHRPTSAADAARVGLVLGPQAAEQLRRDEANAQRAALRTQGLRWLLIGLFACALGGWLWSVFKGGVR